MGYKFQFVTLAGFHALNLSMFELGAGYQARWDDGLFASAGKGIQPRDSIWIRGGEAPALCGNGIL